MSSHLILVGAAVGLDGLEGLAFRADHNHSGCRICGAVFQSDIDRLDNPTPEQLINAAALRTAWRVNHDKQHTDSERRQLALSGLWLTPDAATNLAPFGVIPLSDALLGGSETTEALLEAPRAPAKDSEGG